MGTREEFEGIAEVAGGGLPESKVRAGSTALMIIDMQYVDADRNHVLGLYGQKRASTDEMEYYFSRLETLESGKSKPPSWPSTPPPARSPPRHGPITAPD